MADRKISDLTALTTPASGDYLPIVDISEAAAASKNKRVTVQSLFQGIPVNVGIGTSSPGSLLDLRFATSPATDNGDGFNALRVFTSSALAADTGGAISLGGASTSGGATAAWGQIAGRKENATSANYAGYLQFVTNNGAGTMTERMRIDSSGNVGIGTSSPSYLLDVNGSVRITTSAGNESYFGFGANYDNYFTSGVSGAQIFRTPNIERLRIDSSGNVGIGTSSPTTLLDVNADTVRVRTARTPASASATGDAGEICWDANYIYVCTATNTWKRTALSTW
jgi:hypothetical protein